MRQLFGAHVLVAMAALILASSSTATALLIRPRARASANSTTTASSASSVPWGVTSSSNGAKLDIPARKMWGWDEAGELSGYCGSMSFQMAGLFNGNYVSQERVRYAAGDSELLIGTGNEVTAAKALSYDYSEWNYERKSVPQSEGFIAWAREEVDKGHVVITGWYERQPNGDEDYDHIMPIVGYELDSKGNVDGLYRYDLYLDALSETSGSNLHATRKECSQKREPVQPFEYCLPDDYDYGISIHNVKDTNGELYRMKLVAPSWWEPDYGKEDNLHEAVVDFVFQAVITGLTSGEQYTILRFDSPDAVPSKNFAKGSYGHHQTFTADKETMSVDLFPVSSDGTWFYRTIKGTI